MSLQRRYLNLQNHVYDKFGCEDSYECEPQFAGKKTFKEHMYDAVQHELRPFIQNHRLMRAHDLQPCAFMSLDASRSAFPETVADWDLADYLKDATSTQ